jgi:hypothetical protein
MNKKKSLLLISLLFIVLISNIVFSSECNLNIEVSENNKNNLFSNEKKSQIIKQETLTLKDFNVELLKDSRFNDLYKYANELGYIIPKDMIRTYRDDGLIVQ